MVTMETLLILVPLNILVLGEVRTGALRLKLNNNWSHQDVTQQYTFENSFTTLIKKTLPW